MNKRDGALIGGGYDSPRVVLHPRHEVDLRDVPVRGVEPEKP